MPSSDATPDEAGWDTESVCPVCLARIPARVEREGDAWYLTKRCPQHGETRAVVWRDPGLTSWTRPKTPSRPAHPRTEVQRGCPFDCGLCPEHGQHTCTALLEITWRCDLGCPVCFASAGGKVPDDPPLERLSWQLDQVLAASGRCNVQLSGGEPSVRDDLPEVVALAKSKGFPFVQLNTNGLRAAREADFAPRLAEAGLDSVFLQFDGLTDDVFRRLRGRPLWEIKQTALERFTAAGIGVVLVPTLVPGVNDAQVGDLLRFAAAHSPGVRGLHFQPVSYFGRYPTPPADADRLTLPELMRALETQTDGLVHAADFLPPGCEHSRCSFHANYLVREDGGLTRLSGGGSCGCRPPEDATPAPKPILAAEGATKSKAFVSRQWAAPKSGLVPLAPSADDLDRFLARARTHILAVSAMAFQDAWTLDLERLRGCCIHVCAPDGRLIPFCAYNLTAADGTPLYRRTGGRTA